MSNVTLPLLRWVRRWEIVNLFDGDERLWDSAAALPEKGDVDGAVSP